MAVEIGEYNGNPVIILKRDENDKYPFRFGVGKAQLIINNILFIINRIINNKLRNKKSRIF